MYIVTKLTRRELKQPALRVYLPVTTILGFYYFNLTNENISTPHFYPDANMVNRPGNMNESMKNKETESWGFSDA